MALSGTCSRTACPFVKEDRGSVKSEFLLETFAGKVAGVTDGGLVDETVFRRFWGSELRDRERGGVGAGFVLGEPFPLLLLAVVDLPPLPCVGEEKQNGQINK